MAGLGSRFKNAGFVTPKPLIEVQGRPMYSWAVDSLPLERVNRLIFVLLATQPEVPQLEADIRKRYSRLAPIICAVPELTAGQAITVLRAREWIDNNEPLLIHNADTAFTVEAAWVDQAWSEGCDGALLVFTAQDPRWSYSREGADGWVTEVREKNVISPWASTGTYWFRRGADFVRLAQYRRDKANQEASEYYVGPLYNDLISASGRVRNFPVNQVLGFGTPDEYAQSLALLGG